MTGELSTALVIEIMATSANLLYIVFLIREKIICWSFGIAGSLLSVYLFTDAKLYSEAFLYLFYVALGCWGWIRWHRREQGNTNRVITWRLSAHLRAVALCTIAALGLGYTTQALTDAERPLFDAFTTVFSFLATYMEVTKVLEGWIYWFLINLASIWLYHDRNLDIYAVLIGLYSVMSVWGFISWLKSYRDQDAALAS